jgi:FAD/FMN-containing dehydrogenase
MVMFAPFFMANEPFTRDEESAEEWKKFGRYLQGSYDNFLNDSGPAWVVEGMYSPETYARLRVIKATYDPHNVFHLNNNIIPA